MIKYFIKQYGRYIAMALAFATITFLINSCEVKAEGTEGIEVESIPLNVTQTLPNGSTQFTIINNGNLYKNWGRATLLFTIYEQRYSASASTEIPFISSVEVTSTNHTYTCDIGSVNLSVYDNEQEKAYIYSVTCDVVLGSSGLQSIIAYLVSPQNSAVNMGTSRVLSVYKNIDDRSYELIKTIANYQLQQYNKLTDISTTTGNIYTQLVGNTNQIIASTSQIISAMGSTTSAINNQTQQQHQDAQSQKESTDAINNSINNGDTSSVNLDTITGQSTDVGAISGLITIPLTLLSGVITAFNGTCMPYNVGSLFNTNIVFPCINLQSILGSFLWDTIDILISGIFIFYISKKFINLFNKLINLENIRLGVVDFV